VYTVELLDEARAAGGAAATGRCVQASTVHTERRAAGAGPTKRSSVCAARSLDRPVAAGLRARLALLSSDYLGCRRGGKAESRPVNDVYIGRLAAAPRINDNRYTIGRSRRRQRST